MRVSEVLRGPWNTTALPGKQREFPLLSVSLIGALTGLSGVFMLGVASLFNGGFSAGMWLPLAAAVVLTAVSSTAWVGFRRLVAEQEAVSREALPRFAEANGLGFAEQDASLGFPQMLFFSGDRECRMEPAFQLPGEVPIVVGNHHRMVRRGDSAQAAEYGLVAVPLPGVVPSMVVLRSTGPFQFAPGERLRMNPEADAVLAVFVPQELHAAAMEFLTPDVVAAMVDHPAVVGIFTYDGWLLLLFTEKFALEDPVFWQSGLANRAGVLLDELVDQAHRITRVGRLPQWADEVARDSDDAVVVEESEDVTVPRTVASAPEEKFVPTGVRSTGWFTDPRDATLERWYDGGVPSMVTRVADQTPVAVERMDRARALGAEARAGLQKPKMWWQTRWGQAVLVGFVLLYAFGPRVGGSKSPASAPAVVGPVGSAPVVVPTAQPHVLFSTIARVSGVARKPGTDVCAMVYTLNVDGREFSGTPGASSAQWCAAKLGDPVTVWFYSDRPDLNAPSKELLDAVWAQEALKP